MSNRQIGIGVELSENNQSLQVDLASSIVYVLSPTAKVELLNNGNYLITITDKNGTTTAEIPIVNESTIANLLSWFFEQNTMILDCGHADDEYS